MKVNQCFESDMGNIHTDTHSYHYPALQLLSFYNWAELILQRMDQNLFWEEIKVVLGTIIQEKLGKADTAHGKGALITPGRPSDLWIHLFSMRSRDCCSHILTHCNSHAAHSLRFPKHTLSLHTKITQLVNGHQHAVHKMTMHVIICRKMNEKTEVQTREADYVCRECYFPWKVVTPPPPWQ